MAQPLSRYTIDQYLAMERASDVRHVFLDGQIFAMAGESLEHGTITVNLIGVLFPQLKGKPCRALTKDTKVRSGPILTAGETSKGLFSYPDIVVVCEEPKFHDAFEDVILNPTAIIEVLSPSTEQFDRGEKWTRYQTWNPTLRDYLLVSQNQPQIDHYARLDEGKWTYQRHVGLEATVTIASIGCVLKLADVYDRVTFRSE